MELLTMIAVAVFSALLSQLLQPIPDMPAARRYGLNEFDIPTATEDRALPVVFGTVPVAGNLTWFGDYLASEKTKKVKVNMFKSAKQSLGYRYHIGMWLTLSGVPVDEVVGIKWGERTAWTGNQTLSKTTTTDINVSHEYYGAEGQSIPDGITGTFRFFNQAVPDGNPNIAPLANSYLAAQLGEPVVPSYPGTCHVIFMGPSSVNGGGFVGSSPRIPPLKIIVKRLPAIKEIVSNNHQWIFSNGTRYAYPVTGPMQPGVQVNDFVDNYIDSVADIDGDANPAFIIAELLCARNQYIGPRLSPFALDWDSFMRVAETLKNEGMGISFAWEKTRSVGAVIADVCKQINCCFQVDESTGKFQIRLVRESDQPVFEFNSDNIVAFAPATRVVMNESPNEIQVSFSDRSLHYEPRTQVAKNLAMVHQVGTNIAKELNFIGVSNARVASMLATRELRTLASSLMQVRFTARLPIAKIIKPGEVIMVSHERLQQVLRMRVTTARWNDYQNRQEVEFEAIEDVFRDGSIDYASEIAPPPVIVPTVPPTVTPRIMAAPYALVGDTHDHALYFAEVSSVAATKIWATASENRSKWSESTSEYAESTTLPAVSGVLEAALSSTNRTTARLTLTAEQAQIYRAIQPSGSVLAIVGDEMLFASGLTLTGNTLNISTLSRGIFDTIPGYHAAGAKFTLLTGYTVMPSRMRSRVSDSGPNEGGVENLAVRADIYTRNGIIDANDAPSTEALLSATSVGTSRSIAPLSPTFVRAGGNIGVNSILDSLFTTISRSAPVVAWTNRNRYNATTESAFTILENPEPTAFVDYSLGWETEPGSGQFTSTSFSPLAAGATQVVLDMTLVPPGARWVRVNLRASRPYPHGSGSARSAPRSYYWKTSS